MGPSPHAIRTRQIPPSAGSFFARCLDSRALPRLDFLRADGPRRGSACGGQGIEQAVSNKAPIDFERRAETLAYEVKGEVTANGRRRRTFVRKGLRPAPRRMNPPHACLRFDSPRIEGPRRGRQGSGQMSPGVGRWPSPPPLLCPDPCPSRRGSACGGQGTEQAAFNKAPIDFERRVEALAYEVEGEVTANGRRRRTFVREGLRPAPRRTNPPRATQNTPRRNLSARDHRASAGATPGTSTRSTGACATCARRAGTLPK